MLEMEMVKDEHPIMFWVLVLWSMPSGVGLALLLLAYTGFGD